MESMKMDIIPFNKKIIFLVKLPVNFRSLEIILPNKNNNCTYKIFVWEKARICFKLLEYKK